MIISRLLMFAVLLGISSPSEKRGANTYKNRVEEVYICVSNTAVAYHKSESCRGIKKCTHQIKKVTKDDAIKKYKYRACKICY